MVKQPDSILEENFKEDVTAKDIKKKMGSAIDSKPVSDDDKPVEQTEPESTETIEKSKDSETATRETPHAPEENKISFDPVYLDEVKSKPDKNKKGNKAGNSSKRLILCSLVIIVLSGISFGAYIWWRNNHQIAIQQPEAVSVIQEKPIATVKQTANQKRSDNTEMLTESQNTAIQANEEVADGIPLSVKSYKAQNTSAETVYYSSKELDDKISELNKLWQTLRSKKDEIESLQAYYRNRIKEKETEIIRIINKDKTTTFTEAMSNDKIMLALRAIQRRQAYINKLNLPLLRLNTSSEEILYYQRLAEIYKLMTSTISALPVEKLSQDINSVVNRNTKVLSRLEVQYDQVTLPPLKTIWQEVAKLAKSKSSTAASKWEAQNSIIWRQICNGDYLNINQLTYLNTKVATCLLNWPGKDLLLNEVNKLSPEVAKILSQWPGEWLSLNGITDLTPETARHLAQWPGKRLSLNGLVELSDAATRELSKWQGEHLEMIGLKKIGRWDNYSTKLYLSENLRKRLEITN